MASVNLRQEYSVEAFSRRKARHITSCKELATNIQEATAELKAKARMHKDKRQKERKVLQQENCALSVQVQGEENDAPTISDQYPYTIAFIILINIDIAFLVTGFQLKLYHAVCVYCRD